MKSRPSMEKRRKEQARKDRRMEKAERRERRKAEREQQRESGDAVESTDGMQDQPPPGNDQTGGADAHSTSETPRQEH